MNKRREDVFYNDVVAIINEAEENEVITHEAWRDLTDKITHVYDDLYLPEYSPEREALYKNIPTPIVAAKLAQDQSPVKAEPLAYVKLKSEDRTLVLANVKYYRVLDGWVVLYSDKPLGKSRLQELARFKEDEVDYITLL